MAGPDTSNESAHVTTQDHAAEDFGQSTEGSLTPEEFSARVAAKREQAAQDAGWVTPPQPDAPLPEAVVDDHEPEVISPPALPEEQEEEPEEEVTDEPEPEPEDEEPPKEGEEEEEQEPPEDEADEEFFLDTGVSRYRTAEEAIAGYREKDATINRLYQELHQRTRAIEQAAQQRAAEIDPAEWSQWAQEAVENGAGEQGALAALEQGGEDGYDIYVAHWISSEDEETRAQALAFNNKVQREFAQMRAEAARPAAAVASPEQEAEVAKQRIAQIYPDFGEYTEQMDRLINEPGLLPVETKDFLSTLARNGIDGKERAWDYLYVAAKALVAPTRRKAAETEKKQRKASSDRAKVAAMVSSSEATPTRTPHTEDEEKAIAYKNQLRERWGLEPVAVD